MNDPLVRRLYNENRKLRKELVDLRIEIDEVSKERDRIETIVEKAAYEIFAHNTNQIPSKRLPKDRFSNRKDAI